MLYMVNLKGEIVKTKPFSGAEWHFLKNDNTNNIYLKHGSRLKILDKNLDSIKDIKFADNQEIVGFKDLNDDGKQELITLDNNTIVIYEPDLKSKTKILHNICNTIGNSYSIFETFKIGNETFLNIDIGDSSFILKYDYNNKFYLKYLAFLLIFGLWNFILWGILKLNSLRLEAENKKLEEIVNQRTIELSENNQILLSQKEEINAQATELKTTNEHLLELSNFKEIMTDTVIHDLKNPLNSILNLSPNKRITQAAHNMLNLVMNILDVHKYEDKKMLLSIEYFSLKEIIKEAISRVKLLLDEKNIQINRNYSPNIELKVDKSAIVRVFINLLSNAIKFSSVNGEINIEAAIDNENIVHIKLIDHGLGIREDKLSDIFDKFEQSESRDFGSVKSTGLGLTYCKMAIEAHGGNIRAENNSGGGAAFIFELAGRVNTKVTIKNDSNIVDDTLVFTESELAILKPTIQKLKNIPIFEATDILIILNDLRTENRNILKWKESIKNAVFSGNNIHYDDLIDLEQS